VADETVLNTVDKEIPKILPGNKVKSKNSIKS
jgi:hypothetical protein